MTHIRLTNDQIDTLIAGGRAHHAPLLHSVRDLDLGIHFRREDDWPVEMPIGEGPVVVLIEDDADDALAPTAFHNKSLHRLVRWADCAILIARSQSTATYEAAAIMATCFQLKTLLIETRGEQAQTWLDWVTTANSEILFINDVDVGAQS